MPVIVERVYFPVHEKTLKYLAHLCLELSLDSAAAYHFKYMNALSINQLYDKKYVAQVPTFRMQVSNFLMALPVTTFVKEEARLKLCRVKDTH